MKKHISIFAFVLLIFSACIDEPEIQPNTYKGNFEALWSIIDTKYCYLDYKSINWDSIHTAYSTKVENVKTELAFFDLMGSMLAELKDGHVNLYSDFDKSRYWKWFLDYPDNFSSNIIYSEHYLGDNYRIAGGLNYEKINNGNIGYIYLGSFENYFSDNNIAYTFNYFSKCKGLIIDVRNNGGGSLDYSQKLASYFFDKETVTGYMEHKTGSGHSDFSDAIELKTPSHSSVQWLRPVVVLTNRMSYSATNDFVNRMKQAHYSTIVGDKTGGGGGLPLSSELPNGWLVRFSACPMFNSKMEHTEWGIDPDVAQNILRTDSIKEIDTIIEKAIEIINSKK